MLLSVNGLNTLQYMGYKGFFQNISVFFFFFFPDKNSSVYMFNILLIQYCFKKTYATKKIVCVIVTRLSVFTISIYFTRHKIIIRIESTV